MQALGVWLVGATTIKGEVETTWRSAAALFVAPAGLLTRTE